MGIAEKNDNPKIIWIENTQRNYLKFIFQEKLYADDAITAIKKWKEEFAKKPNEKITLIWDCMIMKDYEPKARILWQKAIKDMKNQIENILLITESRIIKLGAIMISTFTSFNIEVFDSEDKIIFN